MRGMEHRAAALGAARAVKLAARLAGQVATAVPSIAVAAEADRVVLSGRGLVRRAVTDPLLRDLGSWVR